VCGVALAKFFYVETAKKDASQIAPYIKYGATCGLAGLGVVLLADMAFLGMLRTEYYLVWRAGGLLPLHCLLLMGLAAEQDPVAKVFKTPMLKHIGEVSYAQYVIQTVVFRSTTQWCIGSEWDRYQVYPFVLYACAYFAHHAVIKVYATLR
jgi:peptidoglycan/LPS O-acetylase OafA/YrhL